MADYLVNLEAYKKACVNKSRQMMHCNGKCQMLKKLKKQEGGNGTSAPAPKFNVTEVVLSSKSFYPSIDIVSLENNKLFHSYFVDFNSAFTGAIFHPPSV